MKWAGLTGILLASVCQFYPRPLFSQGNTDSVATENADCVTAGLFSTDKPLSITLHLDLGKFLKSKKEPVFVDALCTTIRQGDTVKRKIQIKARGEMRRAYCHFPPLLLKFGHHADGFPVNGTLKMIIPCFPTLKYENYVLKEYLAYRLFNEVTPYSLKTRLVWIRLCDSLKPLKTYEAYGFLIENEKAMAERNNAVLVKNPTLTQRHMNPVDITRIAYFNYMIGNTDWSVPYLHNIRVVKQNSTFSVKGVPVAYDFDYAGLVNPPYAVPAKELPIKEVRERYYMGMCENSEMLKTVIDEFGSKEDRFLSIINDFEYLKETEKKYTLSYVENFYRSYKNPNALHATVNKTCKQ